MYKIRIHRVSLVLILACFFCVIGCDYVYMKVARVTVSTDWPIKQLQLIEQKTEVHILDRNWDRATVFFYQSMRSYQTLFFMFSIANFFIFCRNSSFLFICTAKIIIQWSTSNKTFQKLWSIPCDLWAPVRSNFLILIKNWYISYRKALTLL